MAVIEDKYIFDLNTEGAKKEIIELVNALKEYDSQAVKTRATDQSRAGILQLLKRSIEQQAKTLSGAAAKQEALRVIQARLTAVEKENIKLTAQLAKTNEDLAAAVAKATKNSGRFENRIKSATGLLSKFSGATAAITGLGGLGAAWGLDQLAEQFNLIDQNINSVQTSISGLTRGGAGAVAADIAAIGETFGLEFDKILDAVKVAGLEFGLGAKETLAEIELGLVKSTTARTREEVLENLREYSTFFREAGLSLKDSIEVINLGDSLGVFNDKAADAVKETAIRLGEATKTTVDGVINAFGKNFANKLFSDIRAGLPTFEALRRISKEIGAQNLNVQQYNELVAAIGGGALEDAGRTFLQSLTQIGTGAGGASNALNQYQETQIKLLQTNKEAARLKKEVAEELFGLSREYNSATAVARIYALKGLSVVIEAMKTLPRFIRENKAELAAIAGSFALLRVGAAVQGVKSLSEGLKALIIQQRLFNAVAKTNPYILLASGVTALVAAISILNKERSEEARISEAVTNATKSITENYIQEKAELDGLFQALRKTNPETEARRDIVAQINEKYGEYLGNIDLEKAGLDEIAGAYRAVNAAILQNIVAQQKRARATEIIEDITKKQIELNNATEESAGIFQKIQGFGEGVAGLLGGGGEEIDISGVRVFRRDLQAEINALSSELGNLDGVFAEAFKQVLAQLETQDLSGIFETPTKKGSGAAAKSGRVIGAAVAKGVKEGIKESGKSIEESLTEIGAQIEALIPEIVGKAEIPKGTGEAILAVINNLEKSIDELENQARKTATIGDLPRLQRILDAIREEKTLLDGARAELARLTPKSLSPEDIKAGTKAAPYLVPVELLPPEDEIEVEIEVKTDPEKLKKQIEKIIDGAAEIFAAGFDLAGAITERAESRFDNLVSKQENTIAEMEANSGDYNARQFEIERERLRALEEEQRAAAERAAEIAQIEIAANAALAIAKAATQPFPANLIAITSTLAALAAGFIRARTAAAGAFAEGVDAVPLAGNPPGRDTVPANLTAGEGVLQVKANKAYKKTFRAMRRFQIPPALLEGFTEAYKGGQLSEFAKTILGISGGATIEKAAGIVETKEGIKELKRIRVAITAEKPRPAMKPKSKTI